MRLAGIQACKVGDVKWPVYWPLGLCGVLLLAGKPASSGERFNIECSNNIQHYMCIWEMYVLKKISILPHQLN